MKILAVDIAAKTGWAFGDDIARAHSGVWRLPSFDDYGINAACGSIYSAVNSLCRANAIEAFVCEASLMGIERKNKRGVYTPTSRHGDRVLGFLSGAARAGASNAGVKCLAFPAPSTWRKAVLGEGYPDKPKEAALNYCRMILGQVIEDDNQAEALCMMQYGRGVFIGARAKPLSATIRAKD